MIYLIRIQTDELYFLLFILQVKHGIDNPAMLENGSTEQVCTPEKNEKK